MADQSEAFSATITQDYQIRMARLLISGNHSDFQIKTSNYTFKVNSAILYAQGGLYFQGLFDSAFKETETRRFELDADSIYLTDVLFEIYTGVSCSRGMDPALARLAAELEQMVAKVVSPGSHWATLSFEELVEEHIVTTDNALQTDRVTLDLLYIYGIAHLLMMSTTQSDALEKILSQLGRDIGMGEDDAVVNLLLRVYCAATDGMDELRSKVTAVCFKERNEDVLKEGSEARKLVMEGEPVAWAAMEALEAAMKED
jgi:DNA-binding transcriptional regulator YbjK